MLPVRLKMRDFLSYEDEDFDFSKISCATVIGDNGAGKSSFCTDAITFALYGAGSKGGLNDMDNYVRKGADSCTVELTFALGEDQYKVVRTRSKTKGKTYVTFFSVTKSGDEIPLGDGKVNSTQDLIESTLHMNYRTFVSTALIVQGRSGMFTEGMSDSERKEALIEIMDIGAWTETQVAVNDRVKELNAEIKSISMTRDAITTEDRVELSTTKCRLESEIAEKEKDIERLEKEADKSRADAEKASLLSEQKKDLEGNLDRLRKNAVRLLGEKKEEEADLLRLEEQTKKDSAEKSNLEKIVDAKDAILQRLKEKEDAQNALSRMEEQRIALLTLEKEVQDTIQKGKLWNTTHENAISQLQLHIKNRETQAKTLDDVPCADNEDLTSTCKFLSMARKAKEELAVFQKELEDKEKETNPYREAFSEAKKKHEEAKAGFSEEALLMTKKKIQELTPFDEKKRELDRAEVRLTSLRESVESREETKKSRILRIKRLEEEIRDAEKEAPPIKERIVKIDSLMESLSTSATTFQKIIADLSKEKENLQTLRVEHARIISRIEATEKAIEERARLEKEYLAKEDALATALLLQEACSKHSGVPAFLIENAVPELEHVANELLDNMTEGKLSIHFSTQENTKKNTVKEVLKIKASYYGEERDYQTFSGAERFIIDLAIRIALSKFLAHRAGASVQLFVLDEGVSCADENNREEIMDAIRSLSSEFGKILFVTHITELKDVFGQKVLVRKDSRGSHLQVA